MTIVELILDEKMVTLFKHSLSKKTTTYRNGNFYKVIYFLPLTDYLTPFSYKGVEVTLLDERREQGKGWELVRNLKPVTMGKELLEVLHELERDNLLSKRDFRALELRGEIADLFAHGIYTVQDTFYFVRVMAIHGYSFDDIQDFFTNIMKRKDLCPYFIKAMEFYYKEEMTA